MSNEIILHLLKKIRVIKKLITTTLQENDLVMNINDEVTLQRVKVHM